MKVVIYARVSTEEQELQHQIDACQRLCDYKQFEVIKIYSEKITSSKANRPQYLKVIQELREGYYDGVVVFRLDRLGRNARELSLLVEELENKGIKVLSVSENFDTSTAMGRAMREIIMVFAQLEREQIGEATKQRLQSLKASGTKLGQKPLSDYQIKRVMELAAQGLSCRKIAEQMQVSKSAAYNVVHRKGYYGGNSENTENLQSPPNGI